MRLQSMDGTTAAQLQPKTKQEVTDEAMVSHETKPTANALPEDLQSEVLEQIEISFKYAGYIDKQKEEIERLAAQESVPLPADFDYMAVDALSIEVRQRLSKQRPNTLGQAARISGVTPAAVSLLLIHLKKKGGKR